GCISRYAAEGQRGGDMRVLENFLRQRLLALGHRPEGDRLRRLGDALDDARVLDREEAFRNRDIERGGERECAERDDERRGLAVEHPAQGAPIAANEGV